MYILYNKIPPHPFTINTICNYTQYTHALIIFIVLYPSCTQFTSYPTHTRLSLGSMAWSVCTSLLSDITHSLLFKIFLHAGTQETSIPTPLRHALWTTRILSWTFREASYSVTFNLYPRFILRPLDLLCGCMPLCLHAHIRVVRIPHHILSVLFLPLIFMSWYFSLSHTFQSRSSPYLVCMTMTNFYDVTYDEMMHIT